MRSPFVSRRKHEAELVEASHKSGEMRSAMSSREAGYAQQAREKHAAEIQAIIDGIAHEYYLASAIYHLGRPGTPSHVIGMMDGLRRAMAAAVGRDSISVGFRMENGIPQGSEGTDWIAVVDNADTNPLHVVLHDGVREPVADRLDHLHMQALRKDNHPLYAIITQERAEAKADAEANA